MTQFDDIRPYNDDEVRPTLDRILNDPELSHAVASLRFPRLAKALPWVVQPLVRSVLRRQLAAVDSVHDFQAVIEKYMRNMVDTTTTSLTVSGLDQLDAGKSYLFISNHRDIAMDPALLNWVLYHNGHNTVRIAIGDNLLTKPYVSDLMRLNKSFIVNRSATSPRNKLKVLKHLSKYIYHSLNVENANIWIAQREGRAKDGLDRTNAALVTMFALSKAKTTALADHIKQLSIVPVSISYELDPCDGAKAFELYEQRSRGSYEKDEHEDVASIAAGIAGKKGHVHVAFGDVLRGDYANTEEVAADIDRQIIQNYVLYPSNCAAYEQVHGTLPPLTVTEKQLSFVKSKFAPELQQFNQRLSTFDTNWRQIALEMYANPVVSKLQVGEKAG